MVPKDHLRDFESNRRYSWLTRIAREPQKIIFQTALRPFPPFLHVSVHMITILPAVVSPGRTLRYTKRARNPTASDRLLLHRACVSVQVTSTPNDVIYLVFQKTSRDSKFPLRDGNENVNKTTGSISKTTTLSVRYTFCTFHCRFCTTTTRKCLYFLWRA